MSLANKISILRILLVPGIVASLVYYHAERDGLRYLALGLFGIANWLINAQLSGVITFVFLGELLGFVGGWLWSRR